MATIAAVITQAKARFSDPSNDLISDAQWLAYMNYAYQYVNRSTPLWPWLEATAVTSVFAANTNTVTLPANTVAVNWAYDVTHDHRLVPQMGKGDQYHTFLDVASTSDVPVTYQVRDDQLVIWPKNSIAISVKFEPVTFPDTVGTTDPTSASAVPHWPAAWHNVLQEGMLAQAYLDDMNDHMYQIMWQRFLDGLAQMVNAILTVRTETYTPIRDRFWD